MRVRTACSFGIAFDPARISTGRSIAAIEEMIAHFHDLHDPREA